jgi:hypothetical protein
MHEKDSRTADASGVLGSLPFGAIQRSTERVSPAFHTFPPLTTFHSINFSLPVDAQARFPDWFPERLALLLSPLSSTSETIHFTFIN